jgi:hypothetical protein
MSAPSKGKSMHARSPFQFKIFNSQIFFNHLFCFSLLAVTVVFKNVGDAPVLKERRLTINESDPFIKIFPYLRSPKRLNLDASVPLFLYLKDAFTPQPTEKLGTLADAFGFLDNGTKTLVVQYAITPAWG